METWKTKNSANWGEPVVVHDSFDAAMAYATAWHKSSGDVIIDTENKVIYYRLEPRF